MQRKKRRSYGWLQVCVHMAALLPLAWLTWQATQGALTANPIQAAEQRTGDTAITLLLLSLACTPLLTITQFAPFQRFRRPLGVYAFLYASIHFSLFVGLDYLFDFRAIWADTSGKRYIWVGLAAFVGLIPLAATSFTRMMRRMGKDWKRLHRVVYAVAVLAVIHFAWVVKGDLSRLQGDIARPALAVVVVALLLAARLPAVRKRLRRT